MDVSYVISTRNISSQLAIDIDIQHHLQQLTNFSLLNFESSFSFNQPQYSIVHTQESLIKKKILNYLKRRSISSRSIYNKSD